ncbi:MAG: GNAT family N-acetyltransferase [Aliiglaciecola sp.]|uniref:GNAT family N-acetyltransferase n=1 Tax=Aliiglaciecola sp. TaxID=1872441 RepID=UPI0032970E10
MEIPKTEYLTQRFQYISICDEDQAIFCDLYCNDVVMGKIMPKLTTEQAKSLFKDSLRDQQQHPHEFWCIKSITSGQSIGIQGFMANREQRKRGDAEFGILLKPEFYGNNVATESVTAMLFHGFQHLKLNSAHAYFNINNAAILKIARKLGFTITVDDNQPDKMCCSISKAAFLSFNKDSKFVSK